LLGSAALSPPPPPPPPPPQNSRRRRGSVASVYEAVHAHAAATLHVAHPWHDEVRPSTMATLANHAAAGAAFALDADFANALAF
jgi:hypothetical protein